MIGVLIYGCGTITATFSVNAWMLLIGWALLEGIGAALMMPATTTLVSSEYKGKDRMVAFGIWGGIAATGAAVGPIVGGFFTTYLSWRLVFGSEVLLVIAIILLRNRLSESQPKLGWKDLDKLGAVLSVSSLFLFVFGVLVLRTPGDVAAGPAADHTGHSPLRALPVPAGEEGAGGGRSRCSTPRCLRAGHSTSAP